MTVKVLLLDGQTVQSISVARSLKQCGYEVSAFIDSKISYGYVSTFIDAKIICPRLTENNNKYKIFLLSFLEANPQDVVIPLYNDSAEFLSRNKNEIEKITKCKCAIPEFDKFIVAHDKEKLMDICKMNNIPHPGTMHLSLENIEDAIRYVGFPALIKPNISAGARGIMLVESRDELVANYNIVRSEYGECTLLEFVDNTERYYNVMLFRDSYGQIHEGVVIEIVRFFPLKGGTSCCCQVVENDYLVSICKKTLNVLNWYGFADFDILESINHDYKIIEINPRIPASIHAAYISGINYPEMIVNDCLEKKIPVYNYRKYNFLRFFGLDVMWFLFSPKRFSFRPSWFHFWGHDIFYQDGSIKDPLPMIFGCLQGIIKYLNPQFRKGKLQK